MFVNRSGELTKSNSVGLLSRRQANAKAQSDADRNRIIEALRSHAAELPSVEASTCSSIRVKKLYSRTFMHADFLLNVPENLSTDWSVILRPEGERCLAILVGNVLTLRARNGNLLATFVCDDAYVSTVWIMDAVLGIDETRMQSTLFVFDLLSGGDQEMDFADFACRRFWLESQWPFHVSQVPQLFTDHSECPQIVLVPSQSASSNNIRDLYYNYKGFATDSLMFYLNSAKYEPGLSQSVLLFRDAHLSRFAIDTMDPDVKGSEMHVVLRISKQFTLSTWDGTILQTIECPSQAVREQAKRGGLVRATVGATGLTDFVPSKKPFPSSLNRIVDQLRKRRQANEIDTLWLPDTVSPITIEDLLR